MAPAELDFCAAAPQRKMTGMDLSARMLPALRTAGVPAAATTPENRETENNLRAALAQAPGNLEAYRQLGEFYFRSHRYRKPLHCRKPRIKSIPRIAQLELFSEA
jgi:hypothetical protein